MGRIGTISKESEVKRITFIKNRCRHIVKYWGSLHEIFKDNHEY